VTDCDTARGRVAIGHERQIAARISRAWSADVLFTGGGAATDVAPVDAILARSGRIVAVVEIKWRGASLSLHALRALGSYLITWRKLRHGRQIGAALGVPYLLVAALSDVDVWWTISSADGAWVERPRVAATLTQRTINGGSTTRRNAFLGLDRMHLLTNTDPGIRDSDIAWDA
jgi:hypothetical protein